MTPRAIDRHVPSLGERLFQMGERLATAGQFEVGPILTANEDDVMQAWRERGSRSLLDVLGITQTQLYTWKNMRGLPTPPRLWPKHRVENAVVPVPTLEPMRLQLHSCPRCHEGAVYRGVDYQGEVVSCMSCGYAG